MLFVLSSRCSRRGHVWSPIKYEEKREHGTIYVIRCDLCGRLMWTSMLDLVYRHFLHEERDAVLERIASVKTRYFEELEQCCSHHRTR